jgi:hypothetical protein
MLNLSVMGRSVYVVPLGHLAYMFGKRRSVWVYQLKMPLPYVREYAPYLLQLLLWQSSPVISLIWSCIVDISRSPHVHQMESSKRMCRMKRTEKRFMGPDPRWDRAAPNLKARDPWCDRSSKNPYVLFFSFQLAVGLTYEWIRYKPGGLPMATR